MPQVCADNSQDSCERGFAYSCMRDRTQEFFASLVSLGACGELFFPSCRFAWSLWVLSTSFDPDGMLLLASVDN